MTDGFTMVPCALDDVRHAGGEPLSRGGRALYEVILDFSRGGESTCTASQETLAKRLHVVPRTVRNWLRELKELGLVRVRRRGLGRTSELVPLLVVERNHTSAQKRNWPAEKEDAQGEEDNGSTKDAVNALPLRGVRR